MTTLDGSGELLGLGLLAIIVLIPLIILAAGIVGMKRSVRGGGSVMVLIGGVLGLISLVVLTVMIFRSFSPSTTTNIDQIGETLLLVFGGMTCWLLAPLMAGVGAIYLALQVRPRERR